MQAGPDKEMAASEHYGPRQTATYDVLVTDHDGREAVLDLVARLFIDMPTFQYHQDLLAARLVYSQLHLPV